MNEAETLGLNDRQREARRNGEGGLGMEEDRKVVTLRRSGDNASTLNLDGREAAVEGTSERGGRIARARARQKRIRSARRNEEKRKSLAA